MPDVYRDLIREQLPEKNLAESGLELIYVFVVRMFNMLEENFGGGDVDSYVKNLRNKVIIFGSGAWGTAIAHLVARNNADKEIVIIARNQAVIDDINNRHCNQKYLQDIILPNNIIARQNLENIDLVDYEFLFIATPAKEFSKIIANIAEYKIPKNLPIVICAKGVDGYISKFFNEIVNDLLPNNSVAIMAGPNFATEVAKRNFSTTTISSKSLESFNRLSALINANDFRCEYFDNPISFCAAMMPM